jgi:hypothetical protein
MIEVFASRSGSPSLKIGGILLHSPYDPAREAERFAGGSLGPEPPSTVVILGEALEYLSRRVREIYPAARVVRIFYSAEVYDRLAGLFPRSTRDGNPRDPDAWHPGLGQGIEDFFRARIGELDVEGLKVLEWPPSAQVFPELSRAANEALQQCLREANGSLVTTLSMGRLWLRNSVSNFICLDEILQGAPCFPERAIVVAASGPSLESAAPVLREIRKSIDIWALPSCARFLIHAGLEPDMFVMTDPGYYAMSHFHHATPRCPIAMPLSAARGAWRLQQGAFLLSQPGQLEDAFLGALNLQAPKIPPHGTVAATALDLARACTSGPVILAGLDMCNDDLISHARPNMFERFFQLQSLRTSPYDGLWFRRSAEMNASRIPGTRRARAPLSLRTYAGWMSGQGAAGKVYRLLPSEVPLPGFVSLDPPGLKGIASRFRKFPAGPQLMRSAHGLSRASRVSLVVKILHHWKESLSMAAKTAGEADGFGAAAGSAIYPLVRQLSMRQLLETRRKARLGDHRGARERAMALLEECGQFLDSLEERAVNAQ